MAAPLFAPSSPVFAPNERVSYSAPQEAVLYKESVPERGEFVKGVLRATDQTQAFGGGAIGMVGDLTGWDGLRDFGFNIYEEQMRQADKNPAAVASLEDIGSVSNFFDWLAGTAGSVIPSAVEAIGAALIGTAAGGPIGGAAAGFAGKSAIKKFLMGKVKKNVARGLGSREAAEVALKEMAETELGLQLRKAMVREGAKFGAKAGLVTYSTAMEGGGNWIDDYKTNGENTNPAGDLFFGVASALTELVGGEGLMISRLFGGGATKRLARSVGEGSVKQVERGFANAAVREVAKFVGAEATQESVQESLGILNSYLVANSIDAVLTEETFLQIVNAGAAGAVAGLGFGAGPAISSGFNARAESAQIRADLAAEESSDLVEQEVQLSQIDNQIVEHQERIAKHQKVASEAMFGNAQMENQDDVYNSNLAMATVLEAEVEELIAAKKKGNKDLVELQAHLKAKEAGRQAPASQRVQQSKDVAAVRLGAVMEQFTTGIEAKIERLRKAGAPAADIEHFKSVLNKASAIATETLAAVERVPTFESFRVAAILDKGIASIQASAASADSKFTDTAYKYANVPADQLHALEGAKRDQRAFESGEKDARQAVEQEQLAERLKQHEALAKQKELRALIDGRKQEIALEEQNNVAQEQARALDLMRREEQLKAQLRPLQAQQDAIVEKNTRTVKGKKVLSKKGQALLTPLRAEISLLTGKLNNLAAIRGPEHFTTPRVSDQSTYLDQAGNQTRPEPTEFSSYLDEAGRATSVSEGAWSVPDPKLHGTVQQKLGKKALYDVWETPGILNGKPSKATTKQKSGTAATKATRKAALLEAHKAHTIHRVINALRAAKGLNPQPLAATQGFSKQQQDDVFEKAKAGLLGAKAQFVARNPDVHFTESAQAIVKELGIPVKKDATYVDIVTKLAKVLSKPGMPYSLKEATVLLETLLPDALNLKPAEGAKWLQENLLISTTLDKASTLFQSGNRGAYMRKAGKLIIGIFKAADKTTMLHETAHAYLDNLSLRVQEGIATTQDIADLKAVQKWLGWRGNQKSFSTAQHEKFAKGFEKYLMTHKAPTAVLGKFFAMVKKWLIGVYRTAEALKVDITPAAVRVYTNMLLGQQGTANKKAKGPKIKQGTVRHQSALAPAATKAANVASTTYKRVVAPAEAEYLNSEAKLDWTIFDSAKLLLQDYYHPMHMMQMALKQRGGKITTQTDVHLIEEAVANKTVEEAGRFHKAFVKPLLNAQQKYAAAAKLSAAQAEKNIDLYLIATHAHARNKYLRSIGNTSDAPSGMTDKRAAEIIAGKEFEVIPQLKTIRHWATEISARQISLMREYKLLPKLEIDRMEKAYGGTYVPLKGWEDMMIDFDPQYKVNKQRRELSFKAAIGRSKDSIAASPSTNLVLQTFDIINVANKAAPGRALLGLIEANKNVEGIENFFFTLEKDTKKVSKWVLNKSKGKIEYEQVHPFKGDPNVFTVVDDTGKKVWVRAADTRVSKAFQGQNMIVGHPVFDWVGNVTNFMAKMSTVRNPAFIYTNPFRDVLSALLNISDEKHSVTYVNRDGKRIKVSLTGEKVRRTMLGHLRGARNATILNNKGAKLDREWGPIFRAFRKNGGFSEQFALNTFDSIKNQAEVAMKKGAGELNSSWHYPKQVLDATVDYFENQSNALENMTRLATFRTLSEAWIAKGMPKEEAYVKAGSAARNITVNFSKRGTIAPVLGPLYMFANASIQGTRRIFKSIFRNPQSSTKMLTGIVGGLVLMASMMRFMGGEDDDGVSYYDKVPSWVKNTNLVFMIPGTEGQYFKLPSAYGWNIFNTFAQMIDQVMHGRKTSLEAASELTNAMFDNFSPVGSPEAGWTTLIPTALRPLLQLETNKGFFGQKIMPEVPSWIKYDYPDSQRYWSTVSPPAVMLTSILNSLTGGSSVKPGLIDVSPETVEHLVGGYLGGVGKLLGEISSTLYNMPSIFQSDSAVTGADYTANLPVARRFFGVTNFYSTLHDYNKLKAEVQTRVAEYKLAKMDSPAAANQYRSDHPTFRRQLTIVKQVDKMLRKLAKLENSIKRSTTVTNEAARLEKIRRRKEKLIKQATKRVNALKD